MAVTEQKKNIFTHCTTLTHTNNGPFTELRLKSKRNTVLIKLWFITILFQSSCVNVVHAGQAFHIVLCGNDLKYEQSNPKQRPNAVIMYVFGHNAHHIKCIPRGTLTL